jgi:hypothetical protein
MEWGDGAEESESGRPTSDPGGPGWYGRRRHPTRPQGGKVKDNELMTAGE